MPNPKYLLVTPKGRGVACCGTASNDSMLAQKICSLDGDAGRAVVYEVSRLQPKVVKSVVLDGAKRRGRPPGSKGRKPAKQDQQPAKRRGRPPGSKNKPKTAQQDPQKPVKRRGRPPGSKNKPKTAQQDQQKPSRRSSKRLKELSASPPEATTASENPVDTAAVTIAPENPTDTGTAATWEIAAATPASD